MIKKQKSPEKLLSSIEDIRARLGDNARDDHLAELAHWEKSIKAATINLSIEKNEGITGLIARAKEEIKAINEALISESQKITFTANTAVDLANREIARQELLCMRRLWVWFLDFFTENREELVQAEKFIDEQLASDDEENEVE